MKRYLCLLALYPCIEAQASEPSLKFPEQKIELPSLSLWGSTRPALRSSPDVTPPSWFETPPKDLPERSFPGNTRLKRPMISADKFIITPNNEVDYKLVVKAPDPAIDYKLTVKNVESTAQK